MTRLVFIAVRATGLNPLLHEPWDVALIERRPGVGDHTTQLFIKPSHLETADPDALELWQFYERTHDFADQPSETPGQAWMGARTSARRIARITAGAVLVGKDPARDAAILTRFLFCQKLTPAWHHRVVDVPTMSYGYQHGVVAQHNHELELQGKGEGSADSITVADAAGTPRFTADALATVDGSSRPSPFQPDAAVEVAWIKRWYDSMIRGTA